MNKETTCCFTGHRNLYPGFSTEKLKSKIKELASKGIDTFISGGAVGFDTVSAEAVLSLKEEGENIKLFLFLPCSNQSEKWALRQKKELRELIKNADFVDMPQTPYFDGCMKQRNYKMVDSSSYCLCYYDGSYASGTAQTVRYARKKNLIIENIMEVCANE